LKQQLKLTSVVVTHDTRLAKKLADRIMFLEGGQAVFFGTAEELDACADPFIMEFLQQDELRLL
jgi:phospholipid/cholesterol/gamma-HCH transport system ATP-binding protein